ncbi:MAG: ATP-binding cassette domain-containing protein [Bacteroidales bacterium]|jgi:ABC-type multidrug transport system ATPase subunit|nr:ATP-binding cassette domain-containing protein [Bacteroidales bacterium]
MSEKILETLMQLFAIIAKPQSNDSERRGVVEAFLKRLLNQELVKEYLVKYDEAFDEAKKKLEKSSAERREGAIAIRIRKLCKEINEQGQLDQEQRIVVVIQALEFCKSGGQEVSNLELGFISTLAEGLNITEEEYGFIEKFVLNSFSNIPDHQDILLIDGNQKSDLKEAKHIYKELLKGQIWILFVPSVKMYFTRYTGSGELSMNGQLLQEDKVYPFSQGSSIKGYKIKPVYYWDVTMQFLKEEFKSSRVVYEVNNIEYRFKSGKVGIHHMSFREESGRMVGIMGASGAGKSTLLSVLNGTNAPFDGEVLINGVSIHNEKEKIKGLIGYVSQDDLLIEELSVFDNLYFNAKLCFDNLTEEEIVARVDSTLKNLGLNEIRDMKVGSPLNKKISGGQRKRLNISLELIREPAIMFLDEPTSGLSSRDSENILDLLKELARKGKLLFIVIHQPSSEIFKMFDKLIILDTGGYLIYNGNPVESIEYFKRKIEQANYNESECYICGNVNPEQIFNIVETRVFTENGQPTDTRRIAPADWSNHYESERKEDAMDPGGVIPEINFKTPNKFKQLVVFTKRDVLSKIADTQYLLITLLEAPVLAFALSFLIRYFDESVADAKYTLYSNSNLPVYIFMSVIIAIFMGLTVSAEEIIKDRKILKREAFLNLSWNSYLMSKVFVQLSISAIQALTFVIIGNSIIGIKGMWFEYWLVLFTCWAGANMLGLVISDSFKAVVTIYILIPFLVIPQIILSGIMVKFEKLNPDLSSPIAIPFYGEFITARWGYEALAVKQFKDNRYDKQFYIYNRAISKAKFKKDFWCNELKGNLETIRSDLDKGTRSENFNNKLLILNNEIKKELALTPDIKFDYTGNLTPEKINAETVTSALSYIEKIRKYYVSYSNNASGRKEALITKLQSADSKAFLKLREDYANESLEEFVTNKNETKYTIDFKGEIVQKNDPIYMDPKYNFIKAHFYAPVKRFFGQDVDTFTINVNVLWVMTIGLYFVLYFRLLKKLLDSGELVIGKKKGTE